MMMRKRSTVTAALLTACLAGMVTGCAADPKQEDPVQSDQGKQQAEQALATVFGIEGSTWSSASREQEPAHAECTIDGDPHAGRQYHWNAAGSAPADPEHWIETVVQMLRGQDRTVSVRSADVGKYGTLHQATADDDGQPLVVVTANSRTTTVTVESVCVAAPDAEAD